MNRLVIKTGKEKGLSYELKPGVNRLGRNPGNDLIIEDATVSGSHCEIELVNDSLSLRDLGSTNGTSMDGQRITQTTVQAGQHFKVGDVELCFDNTPVVVAIPEYNFAEPGAPGPLSDGSPACYNHGQLPAAYTCVQCHRCFCPECVHKLKMTGGQTMLFCPHCSGRCELLPHLLNRNKKKSFLARIREVLKI